MKKFRSVFFNAATAVGICAVLCAASACSSYRPQTKLQEMGITVNPAVIEVPAEVLSNMVTEARESNPAASRSVSYYDAMLKRQKAVYDMTAEEMFDLYFEGFIPEGKEQILELLGEFEEPVVTVAAEDASLPLYSYTLTESKAQQEDAQRDGARQEADSRGAAYTARTVKMLQAPSAEKLSSAFYLTAVFENGITEDGLFFTENTENDKGMQTLHGKTPLAYTSSGMTSEGYQENNTAYPALQTSWAFEVSCGSWSKPQTIAVKSGQL